MTDPRKLLQLRIQESGFSARQFAEDVLLRNEKTIRRWIAGENPIPELVVEWLEDPWALWPVADEEE